MKRSSKDRRVPKICIPVRETSTDRALQSIEEANGLADLIEVRVDYFRKPRLAPLMKGRKKPFIITYRPVWEGGKYGCAEEKRFSVLEEAAEDGAEYVDVEMRCERSLLQHLWANKRETRLILSFHDYRRTPPVKELKRLFDRMARMKGDIFKIVTLAQSVEDNLSILSLLPLAAGRNQEIVAFCMGEKGKMSRIFAPFMGAAWTYASLRRERASAPGQLTARETREIWGRLS